MKKKLYSLFEFIFALIFILVMFGTVFYNKNLIHHSLVPTIIISFIGLTLFLLFIYFKILNGKDISKKKEIIIVSTLMIILLVLQLIISWFLRSTPAWDWRDVYLSAVSFVKGDTSHIDFEYFQKFPNNYGLLYFEILLFKVLNIFHLLNHAPAAMVCVNIILVDISIMLIYLTVRNLFNKKLAICSLLTCFIVAPFFNYLPIMYTDTVSMVYPILMLFIYSLIIKNDYSSKKKFILYILLSLTALIGLKLKFTCVIMFIAIIIDMIMKNKFKDYYKGILVLVISLLSFNFIYQTCESKFNIFPFDVRNNEEAIPYTHWIMMGLDKFETRQPGYYFIGSYSKTAYDYTLSYKTKDERINANVKAIKSKISAYGFKGYTSFLYDKMLFVWSDGSYYAPAFLIENPTIREGSLISDFIYANGKYVKYTTALNTALILFMYMMFIVGSIHYIKKKESYTSVMHVGIFGVLLFFLIWESSARYLTNYVPIFVVATMSGAYYLYSYFNNKNNKETITMCETINIKRKGSKAMKKLYLVIPCYNEEEVLPETQKRLDKKMNDLIKSKDISKDSKVVFVNDGSKDKTWELIEKFHEKNNMFSGINLSRNRGHQNALLAGLMTVKDDCDMVISMDADLQDDINVIDKFIDEYDKGNDIVYGVRSSREKDTFFKKNTALMFYKLMQMMGVEIVYNHADYRLMSKRCLDALEQYKEVNLFLRGLIPLIGFKSSTVEYERNERFAGESKYPLKKMLSFAIDGITSFSIKPIRMITVVGFITCVISFVMLIYTLIRYIMGATIAGWSSLMVSIWILGGLQILSIGIIGEYIGKIYLETKQRPRFIVDKYLK